MLFVVVLIPLSIIVNKTDLRYVTSQNQKLKHVYGRFEAVCKSERELDSLIQTVKNFSDHVGMVFGLDKCAVLVLKRGKMVRPKVIELPDESV